MTRQTQWIFWTTRLDDCKALLFVVVCKILLCGVRAIVFSPWSRFVCVCVCVCWSFSISQRILNKFQIMSSNEKKPNVQPSASAVKTTSADTTSQLNASTISGAKKVSKSETKTSQEYIELRVITSDLNNGAHYKLKPETKLIRLKKNYCKKVGLEANELRFMFEGHRITDDDTPKSLEMKNYDVIEIYQERSGGM